MDRTLTSPDSVLSPQLQRVQFSEAYILPKHPRRRIEVTFQVNRPAFPPLPRPCVQSKRLRSTMNCTLTSPDSVISPQSQRAQFSIAFTLPETPTPPDRVGISGQSTRFSTTNTALRAVKETQEHDESQVDFTRQCG